MTGLNDTSKNSHNPFFHDDLSLACHSQESEYSLSSEDYLSNFHIADQLETSSDSSPTYSSLTGIIEDGFNPASFQSPSTLSHEVLEKQSLTRESHSKNSSIFEGPESLGKANITLQNFPDPSIHQNTPEYIQILKSREVADRQGLNLNEKYLAKSSNSKTVTSPQEAYIKLVPLINSSNLKNYTHVLVETLRLCQHHFSLDEFYQLLQCKINPWRTGKNGAFKYENFKREGLMLCHYIFQTFQHPKSVVGYFAKGLVKNRQLNLINFSEVRRNFLAAKILFEAVKEPKDSSRNVSALLRKSVKDAYFVICKTLSEKHGTFINDTPENQNFFLGERKIGRLINLIFPHVTTRRIGERGNSKSHYVGIQWNFQTIDDEVLQLMMAEARKSAKLPTVLRHQGFSSVVKRAPRGQQEFVTIREVEAGQNFAPINIPKSTNYSFVRKWSRYPATYCSPRTWRFIPGKLPQQSAWACETIWDSAEYLRNFSVQVDYLIANFYIGVLSSGKQGQIFETFFESMKILMNQSIPQEAVLDLYLVVLLLIFPLSLSSKEEISPEQKSQLQQYLNKFIYELQFYSEFVKPECKNHFLNFTNMIRKLRYLTQLTSSQVDPFLVEDVTEEIIGDINRPSSELHISLGISTEIEELVFKNLLIAMKAVSINDDEKPSGSGTNALDSNSIFMKSARGLLECCKSMKLHVESIKEGLKNRASVDDHCDIPFQIFKNSILTCPEFWTFGNHISQLPISIISYVILELHRGMRNISFSGYKRRDTEVSKETFRVWWVYSAITEEYCGILSETAALSERVSILHQRGRE